MLHRLVPFQAAVIHLLDPDRRAAMPVASRGYGEAVSEYMISPANTEEIELLGLTRHRAALRVRDLPVPAERVRGWVEYLRPAPSTPVAEPDAHPSTTPLANREFRSASYGARECAPTQCPLSQRP
jgi:hypothetical protein